MYRNFEEQSECRPETRLVDRFGRRFTYLRVAVNEVCNLRCIYCMPEKILNRPDQERMMKPPEIIRVIAIASNLGIHKIRFTGGEPLLHPDIVELVEATAGLAGIESVHLTTNGVFLADRARDLKRAGLNGVNISMDSLRPETFKELTRRPMLDRVLRALEHVLEVGFDRVKVNVVAMRGVTEDELDGFVALTKDHPLTVRFIELMPFDCQQVWKTGRFYHAERLVNDLKSRFPDLVNSEGSKTETWVLRRRGYRGRIAVIPAYSRDLCGSCSRIRLTADGNIRNCLYSPREFNLIQQMRTGASDAQIADIIRTAVAEKKVDGWEAQRQDGEDRQSMSRIGG